MGIFSFIAIFVLIRRLNASLRVTPLRTKWMSQFTLATWVIIGLYFLAQAFFRDWFILLSGGALLAGAILFAEREPDLNPFNSVLKAHYPLAAASILAGVAEFIAHKFFDDYENFFWFAILGSFVWIFARWATTKKERQELNFMTQQNIKLDKKV